MKIIEILKEDEDTRLSWESNIAMAFKDEYSRYKKRKRKIYINKKDIHIIANTAASNFIDLLIKD